MGEGVRGGGGGGVGRILALMLLSCLISKYIQKESDPTCALTVKLSFCFGLFLKQKLRGSQGSFLTDGRRHVEEEQFVSGKQKLGDHLRNRKTQ